MRTIPLYQHNDGFGPIVAHATVDDKDHDFLSQWFWSLHPTYGEAFREDEHPISMQDVIWERAGCHGLPKHVSKNILDNRRENLTLPASIYQNLVYHGGKWQARISIDSDPIHLGFFPTVDEAETVCENVKEKVLECIETAVKPPPPAFTRPCAPWWDAKSDSWIAEIEVNGLGITVGYFPTYAEANTATDKYFAKEKP